MKKYLFVINNMEIGGTRSSLINLLHLFVKEDVKVDLFLLSPHGEYMNQIDEKVNILPTSYVCETIYTKNSGLIGWRKILGYLLSIVHKCVGKDLMARVIAKRLNSKCKCDYDVVVGFQEGDTVNISAYINGEKHYCWIHNNASDIGANGIGTSQAFAQMNEVFFVAEAAERDFIQHMPSFKEKTRIIRNTINVKAIEDGANEFVNDLPCNCGDVIKIASVGRFAAQKAFYRIIEMAKHLREKGIPFKWIIVGNGPDREEFLKLVCQNELNECVLSLGNRSNPYPYMKWADLLTVTSKYESQPMVILESLILGKPVLSTNFPSAHEILGDKAYAYLCPNTDEGVVEGIDDVLVNGFINKMKIAGKSFEYDNQSILNEILNL